MCGIVAIAKSDGQIRSEEILDSLGQIKHRGPDGFGYWLSANFKTGLGHTRLSIVDQAGGQQPLFNEDRSIVAVVNGEFYDFCRIREDLINKGHRFSSQSDSEILIHLYEEYGVECLKHLRGEFAFALWDESRQELFVARDRFGIKPLHYHKSEDSIYFASEVKAILALGVKAEWDYSAYYTSASLQYLPPSKSLFKNIFQLPPAHYIVQGLNKFKIHKYWDLNYPEVNTFSLVNEATVAEELESLLAEALQLRFQGDLPVCCHLSGGLDSSLLTGIAARKFDFKPHCFSVAFKDSDYNEQQLAVDSARDLGLKITSVSFDADDMVSDFKSAVYGSEGLAVNAHLVAKYKLNKKIREAGYKVAISGEGSDEVFFGYAHLREDLLLDQNPLFASDAKKSLALKNKLSLGLMLSSGASLNFDNLKKSLGFVPAFIKAKASLGYRLHGLLRNDYLESFSKVDPFLDLTKEFDLPKQLAGRSKVHQSAYLWTKLALANYILKTLGDGTEMANSVEGRVPYLDHKLVEFATKLPMNYKIRGLQEKYILHKISKPYVTQEVYQREKHPFLAPPMFASRSSIAGQYLRDNLLSASFKDNPFYDQLKLRKLLDNYDQQDPLEQQVFDPVLMTILSTKLLQESFNL